MNIKRIIREEVNDFDWIQDEEVYYPIEHIRDLNIGKKYYIDYRVGFDNEDLKVPVSYIALLITNTLAHIDLMVKLGTIYSLVEVRVVVVY